MKYGPAPYQEYDMPNRPLIILVHGGGWVGGDKDAPNLQGCERLVGDVISMNYFLSYEGQKEVWYQAMKDVYNLVKHVEKVAPSKIILLGTSAGANIAALACNRWPDLVDGFIGFYGAYDLTRKIDFSDEVKEMIKVYTPYPRRASPYYKLHMPPCLFIHGLSDESIHWTQTRNMHKKFGGTLLLSQDKGHAFNIMEYEDQINEFVRDL